MLNGFYRHFNILLLPLEKNCIIVCMIVQDLSFPWLLGCQNILMSKHISGWNLGFFFVCLFYNTLKVFWTVHKDPFTAPSDSWSFTDFHPLSVTNARKMFCNWFQTLIILWKAALRHRLNSLKARVKHVAIIKNNRTTRALPTYQSFVVKVRNSHVEMVHHFNTASELLMALLLILVLLQAPFFRCSFSLTAEICGKVATAF